MKLNTLYSIVFGCFIFTSCTDIVDITPDDAPELFVVDAWLNNRAEAQVIKVSTTQTYFDASETPRVVGAEVSITSSTGSEFVFENQGDGTYIYDGSDSALGIVGDNLELRIQIGDKILSASTEIKGVPPVDSITYKEIVDDPRPDGIYAQFFARDLPGLGDSYWIKTFKNGEFLNKPVEINIAYDAGPSPGVQIDNIIMIPPIREAINPIPDSINFDKGPWDFGDQIRVEIHSINNEAFSFLENARAQILNGDNTIFAEPLANTSGNLKMEDGTEEVLGIFTVATISENEITVE